jgi:hypothetical protein
MLVCFLALLRRQRYTEFPSRSGYQGMRTFRGCVGSLTRAVIAARYVGNILKWAAL